MAIDNVKNAPTFSCNEMIGIGLAGTAIVAGLALVATVALKALQYSGVDFRKPAAFIAGMAGLVVVGFAIYAVIITGLFIYALCNDKSPKPIMPHN